LPAVDVSKTPEKRSREYWMDLLRGFSILLVILFHSASVLYRRDIVPPEWLTAVNNIFTLFRMPTLVFLSGLLLPASLSKGPSKYMVGKISSILWPLILWTLVYALVVGPAIDGPLRFVKYMAGGSYLWFLSFILVYYVLALPLRWVPSYWVSIVAIGLAVLAPDGSKHGERFFYLMAFFFLGAWVGNHWPTWMKMVRSRWAFLAAPVVLGFGIVSYFSALQYGPYYAVPALCFIMLASALAYRGQDNGLFRPVVAIGQSSLIYYVIHFPLIYLAVGAVRLVGIHSSSIASVVAFLAVLATGTLLVGAKKRVPYVKWLFQAPALPSQTMHIIGAFDQTAVGRVLQGRRKLQ
jgi:surface polysaccharide O-acyltransferase-like enzyme